MCDKELDKEIDFGIKQINIVDPGYFTGEVCNRNGCIGMIQEDPGDGGCRCHINPPCSYCSIDHHFCPECGWDGEQEQLLKIKKKGVKP